MCRSVRKRIPSERISNARWQNLLRTNPLNSRSLRRSTLNEVLSPNWLKQVARQLMAHDALGTHARDEIGISSTLSARPIQAAFASAAAFAVGAVMPLLCVIFASDRLIVPLVAVTSLIFLALLGALAAYAGGAKVLPGAVRVTFWGALAMAITAGVGAIFGTSP